MYQRLKRRTGITVIEVLTSIIVALIGVAGVLVMIPFAVGQAEVGFDQESAYRHGANLAAEFDIKGFSDTARWRVNEAPTGVGTRTARHYAIDPLGYNDRILNGSTPGHFPFVSPSLEAVINAAENGAYSPAFPSADKSILIERINLNSAAAPAIGMTLGLARHHFSWRNDLQTEDPDPVLAAAAGYPNPDMAPPQQTFDVDLAGNRVRRQARGEMSGFVITGPDTVIPFAPGNLPAAPADDYPITDPDSSAADRVREFRNYFLVFKNRPKPVEYAGTARHPYDRVYQVEHPQPGYQPDADGNPANGYENWPLRMAFSGGTLRLTENAALNNSNSISTQRLEIRRDDWMALTNVTFDEQFNRFVQQINFYRVVDAQLNGSEWIVTLQGPDFDFRWRTQNGVPQTNQVYTQFNDFSARVAVSGGNTTVVPSKTYAIHLPDLWAVFERTYR